jgi:hypothetical protein
MNKENKLRTACVIAADLFEMEPETFCTRAYAKLDGKEFHFDRRVVITHGNSFCAVGGVSYLSGLTGQDVVDFLAPSLSDFVFTPEVFNNIKGRLAVIDLLRKAAIRTAPQTEVEAE